MSGSRCSSSSGGRSRSCSSHSSGDGDGKGAGSRGGGCGLAGILRCKLHPTCRGHDGIPDNTGAQPLTKKPVVGASGKAE